jgi:hypothetical protein
MRTELAGLNSSGKHRPRGRSRKYSAGRLLGPAAWRADKADHVPRQAGRALAETFSVIAASLLTEACAGDSAKAAVLARRQYSQRVGREARYSSISASSRSADQSG